MADTVTIVEAPPPSAPPAPTTAISASNMPGTATPAAPPKPGSARERLFADLQKKAKPFGGEPTPEPAKPTAAPKPQAKPKAEPQQQPTEPSGTEDLEEPTEPQTPETPEEPAEKPQTPPKAEKKNPWKMVEEYKARAAKAEQELLETRKGVVPEEQRKKMEQEAESIRKRNEELESEIKFVNYSKSKEYAEQYEKPYNEAWTKAMEEVGEITVEDPNTGERRNATANDLLELVNLPLGQAREIADKNFGPFADDVMGYRKEIRRLFEAKSKALETARVASVERDKQHLEQVTKMRTEIKTAVDDTWAKANATLMEDPKYGKYFKPVEGDENINQRLAKGYQMVDRALNENPHDPRLTAEQRASIVKRHAAMRHRAASFGRVFYELQSATARIAELEAKLSQFEGVEPTTEGGGGNPAAPAEPASARDRMFAELRRRAH